MVPVLEDRVVTRDGTDVLIKTPALDRYGHPLLSAEPVMRGKKTLTREVWVQAPCLPEMLDFLKVSEKTWAELMRAEGFADVCERAKRRIEIFNVQRLDSNRATGAKFALERKFGWREDTNDGVNVAVEMPKELDEWAR